LSFRSDDVDNSLHRVATGRRCKSENELPRLQSPHLKGEALNLHAINSEHIAVEYLNLTADEACAGGRDYGSAN
jgi:hypothetical protein